MKTVTDNSQICSISRKVLGNPYGDPVNRTKITPDRMQMLAEACQADYITGEQFRFLVEILTGTEFIQEAIDATKTS